MNTLLLTLANMGVNLDDVADVVNNCIPQLIFFGVVVAAAIIVLIAMAVNKKLAKPTKFMVRAQSGLPCCWLSASCSTWLPLAP